MNILNHYSNLTKSTKKHLKHLQLDWLILCAETGISSKKEKAPLQKEGLTLHCASNSTTKELMRFRLHNTSVTINIRGKNKAQISYKLFC